MYEIAAIIPTYHRASKIKPLVDNFLATSSQAKLYFVITPGDTETEKEIKRCKQAYFIVDDEFVQATNEAYKKTKEPFIFCGADDIEFTKDWDKKLLESIKGVGVTGGIDDWDISRSGVHTSHPMVSRAYIEEYGGSLGYPGLIYNPNRKHYHVDIELEQLAWSRDMIRINKNCIIPHKHFVNKQADNDATYCHSRKCWDTDNAHYKANHHKFEYWDMPSMYRGRQVPSPYRIKRLSVIMPIWNCEDYTRKTLASLMANTQHPYELILIDDASTEHDGKKLLAELKQIACQKFHLVKTFANPKQLYCNANWNKGVELATGDYIAIINSDIEFLTIDWDDYLMENIDLGYELVNPFQRDRVYPNAYMKPPQEDAIHHLNIRGACYMMSRSLVSKAFPIPKDYVHWCGDNYISSKAANYLYDIRVEIYHHISKSGAKVDMKTFWTITHRDVVNWIKNTNSKDMDAVLNNCERQLKRLNGH